MEHPELDAAPRRQAPRIGPGGPAAVAARQLSADGEATRLGASVAHGDVELAVFAVGLRQNEVAARVGGVFHLGDIPAAVLGCRRGGGQREASGGDGQLGGKSSRVHGNVLVRS